LIATGNNNRVTVGWRQEMMMMMTTTTTMIVCLYDATEA